MCGRFSHPEALDFFVPLIPGLQIEEEVMRRYNVAPSQSIPVILTDDGPRLTMLKWGLVPFWAKDPKIGNKMINARAESVAEKPSYREAFKRRRCLIPADGFYEWRTLPGTKTKTPVYFKMKSGKPFAFGGLWETNKKCGDELRTCTIITTTPNDLVANAHNRMPVIIPQDAYEYWIDSAEKDPKDLVDLLVPYPVEEMEAYEVSRVVNSPANDVEECIEKQGDLFE